MFFVSGVYVDTKIGDASKKENKIAILSEFSNYQKFYFIQMAKYLRLVLEENIQEKNFFEMVSSKKRNLLRHLFKIWDIFLLNKFSIPLKSILNNVPSLQHDERPKIHSIISHNILSN